MTQIAALLRKPTVREAEVTKVKRMNRVVINRCFGGFGLSHEAILRYAEIKGMNLIVKEGESTFLPYAYYIGEEADENYFSDYMINRADPALVKVVEELGEAANGWASELAVVEVTYDVKWHIAEYDGLEHVAEDHRTWS